MSGIPQSLLDSMYGPTEYIVIINLKNGSWMRPCTATMKRGGLSYGTVAHGVWCETVFRARSQKSLLKKVYKAIAESAASSNNFNTDPKKSWDFSVTHEGV